MVCASEKYASEIEIFTFSRGFRTRISRSNVQKRRFHQPMIRQFDHNESLKVEGGMVNQFTGYTGLHQPLVNELASATSLSEQLR
jgi:hypothetical protein